MPSSQPADRAYLLYTLPALAVAAPLLALAALALGVGPAPVLLRVCRIFLVVSPATAFLGLRTLARVGSAAPRVGAPHGPQLVRARLRHARHPLPRACAGSESRIG